jgi:hypothetical protein
VDDLVLADGYTAQIHKCPLWHSRKNNCPKTNFFNPEIWVQQRGFRECLSFSAFICNVPIFTFIFVDRFWDDLKIGKAYVSC